METKDVFTVNGQVIKQCIGEGQCSCVDCEKEVGWNRVWTSMCYLHNNEIVCHKHLLRRLYPEELTTEPLFQIGEVVIYQNGDSFELGVVKEVRIITNYKGKPSYGYFVHYHTGDTAAMTNEHLLHKIVNSHAFEIRRKRCDEA